MKKIFKNLQEYKQEEQVIWESSFLKEQVESVNKRFEDRLLRTVNLRDEIQRGVRTSSEEIEITVYQWINRFLFKTERYAYIDGVHIAGVEGRLVFDLFNQISEFEPSMKEKEFWEASKHYFKEGQNYTAWAFGGSQPDCLARSAKEGIKTTTSSAFALYEKEKEPIPQKGEISIVLYENEKVCCAIRTTDVKVIPFHAIDKKHAFLEGEGDRSLSYWKLVHQVFFKKELAIHNLSFTEDMLVVCETFEKITDPFTLKKSVLTDGMVKMP